MIDREKSHDRERFPSIQEIEAALSEIKEHNSKHTGMGGAISRIINSMESDVLSDNGNAEANQEFVVGNSFNFEPDNGNAEAELSEELTTYNVLPVFQKIGLAIYGGEKLERAASPKISTSAPSRQDLYVDEFQPFQEFLERNAKEISESESVSGMILDIYKSYLKDIDMAKGDYRDALVDDLSKLISIIKKIPFKTKGPDLELGEAYVNWGKTLEFDDYLKARKLGLTNGKSFDAHSWHKDSSASTLELRWESLLNHYSDVLKKYDNQNNLTILMRMEIKDALSSMSEWVEKPPSNIPSEYIVSIRIALDAIKAKAKDLHL